MTELNISIDTVTLERARSKARQEGTSLDKVLRDYLSVYARPHVCRTDAVKNILKLAEAATSGSGIKRWHRDELHARNL
ncbi:MAG: hypothetical protein ACRER1_06335 [Gammaproteobacteria bacterium]